MDMLKAAHMLSDTGIGVGVILIGVAVGRLLTVLHGEEKKKTPFLPNCRDSEDLW